MKRNVMSAALVLSGAMFFSGCGNGIYEIVTRN